MLRRLALLGAGPLFLLLHCVLPQYARLNLTASMPVGIYAITREAPRRGSLVMICIPASLEAFALQRGYVDRSPDERSFCPSGVRPLLKILEGLPHDEITRSAAGFSVNGRLLARSKPLVQDSRGRFTSAAAFSGPLPSATIWLHAPEPRSWDSRYFGPLPISSIKATLKPLLVFQ